MKKTFKTILISATIGAILSYGSIKFLEHKMQEELLTYLVLNEHIFNLKDIHSLCSGLLNANPTEENFFTCKDVITKVDKLNKELENKCPYISFYTTYINELK